MVGSALHYIMDLKHVSCSSALWGYSVSILSLIRNSLVPNAEHVCFFIVMLELFWSMCSCDCQNMVKKALSQVSVNNNSGHFNELNTI